MVKTLAVALVGMAMGSFGGVFIAMMGAGNLAIIIGAVLGGLIFSIAAPRVGKTAGIR